MKKLTPQGVYKLYDKGVQFNTQIGLYDTITKNENFFIGKQWEGVRSNGLPSPVFNFLKRVVLFSVANVSTDNLKLHLLDLLEGIELIDRSSLHLCSTVSIYTVTIRFDGIL